MSSCGALSAGTGSHAALDPALMLRIPQDDTIAIAVSGGADSMALLLLANDWVKQHGGRIVALTVDHGLRPESAEEARQVGRWCEALNIEHHILRIQVQKKTQDAARIARYQLLTDWCREHGIMPLLTAHHQGDQAETLFFRLARGSGVDGLACMQPVSLMHGVRLVRPLLGVRKSQLEALLTERGQPWVEDPSNRNPRYTRTHLRDALQRCANPEDIAERAYIVSQKFGRIRALMEAKLADHWPQVVTLENRAATIGNEAFLALPPEYQLRLLARLITALNGDDHPPRSHQLERLRQSLHSSSQRTTLGGCIFSYHAKSRHWRVAPEKATP